MEWDQMWARADLSLNRKRQEAVAPHRGSITRYLATSAPPLQLSSSSPPPSSCASTNRRSPPPPDPLERESSDGGELPAPLRAAGYDPAVWRALPPELRQELLLQQQQQQQASSSNKRGSGGGGSSSSSGAKKRAKQGASGKPAAATAGAPLTRFFRPAPAEAAAAAKRGKDEG
jgi:hypothetical protein